MEPEVGGSSPSVSKVKNTDSLMERTLEKIGEMWVRVPFGRNRPVSVAGRGSY